MKTRLVRFAPADAADSDPKEPEDRAPTTFDFLGFTHYWGRSRAGGWVVRRKTAKGRIRRTLQASSAWHRANLHLPIEEQRRKLDQKLRGHYGYFGIIGTMPASNASWKGRGGSGADGFRDDVAAAR